MSTVEILTVAAFVVCGLGTFALGVYALASVVYSESFKNASPAKLCATFFGAVFLTSGAIVGEAILASLITG